MSKKRKRIFLNAIKVFHGMSGQKIKIGNQTFDTPFQSKVVERVKEGNEIVLHADFAEVSVGGDTIATLYTFSMDSLGVNLSNIKISKVNFATNVTTAAGRNYNTTALTRCFIDDVVYNLGTGNKRIQFNSDQVAGLDGYTISLRSANTWFITMVVTSADLGLAAFVAGDQLNCAFTCRLYY